MKVKCKVIHYKDELNDEFSFDNIKPKKIGSEYVYVYNSLWKKFTRFFWYRIVALPIATIYLKLNWHHKVVNKKVLKKAKKTSFFIYGNHTHNICDALIPTIATFPHNVYVIVHPNNISMPVLGKITPSLGAIPLPDDMASTKNFMKCIETRVKQNKTIAIYPEAHIWPFYTKIRPFTSLSFRYPVQYKVPAFCFTNVYKKRKFSSKPSITTYIDGPFYPNEELSAKEQREDLRNRIYEAMRERAKMNNIEVIKYIKDENKNCKNY